MYKNIRLYLSHCDWVGEILIIKYCLGSGKDGLNWENFMFRSYNVFYAKQIKQCMLTLCDTRSLTSVFSGMF